MTAHLTNFSRIGIQDSHSQLSWKECVRSGKCSKFLQVCCVHCLLLPGYFINMYHELLYPQLHLPKKQRRKQKMYWNCFTLKVKCLSVLSLILRQKMRVSSSLVHLCEMLVAAVHKNYLPYLQCCQEEIPPRKKIKGKDWHSQKKVLC